MKIDNEYSNVFEDVDDWFDFFFEDLRKAVKEWVKLSKFVIKNKEVSKEILQIIIDAEIEDQYDKTYIIVERTNHGNIISSLIIDRKKDNER